MLLLLLLGTPTRFLCTHSNISLQIIIYLRTCFLRCFHTYLFFRTIRGGTMFNNTFRFVHEYCVKLGNKCMRSHFLNTFGKDDEYHHVTYAIFG